MPWFKHSQSLDTSNDAVAESSAELSAHKDAKHEVVEDAKAANAKFKKLLDNNGFTLQIYLAAGGKHPVRGHR